MGVEAQHETVVVEKMAAGGDGIAHAADGRVLFVTGGLPGERVRVAVHTRKKDFARGTAVEVLDAAAERVTPPCTAWADGCGGCAWQHVSTEGQRALKASIVADALRRTGRLPDAEVRIGGGVGPWEYRTTMRLAVGPGGAVGLREGSSHRVVTFEHCPVAHPDLAALLPGLRVRGTGEITLRVGVATGTATALPADRRARIEGLSEHVGVGPDATLVEQVAGVALRVSAASFFQSGPAAAELLVRTVSDAAGPLLHDSGPVLDAYGGVGLFAAGLEMEHPVLVESSRSACDDARVNLPHAEVVCAPFEQWRPQPVRLAVVDPARAGLGADGAAVLADSRAERIVLVSCDPVSLARDTVLLGGHGYRHAGSTVLDLFPNTPHVEVVTVFDRV